MNDCIERYAREQRNRQPQLVKYRGAILCLLRRAKATAAIIEYDGEGDSGCIEPILTHNAARSIGAAAEKSADILSDLISPPTPKQLAINKLIAGRTEAERPDEEAEPCPTVRSASTTGPRWLIGATGGFYAEGVTGTDEGTGTINATNYYVSDTASSGTGGLVRATSPTLVTPALGTPSSGVLSNCTGYPASALSSLGAGVATWLATPSSANLRTALTDSTGTGVNVFDTAPTFTTSITSPKVIGGTGTGSTRTPRMVASAGGEVANRRQ